jgi:phospholipase D1/2
MAILRPGETCWRVARADRAAFLVDADAYFTAFRQAVLSARREVMILGWDVDSRVRLIADERPSDGFPTTLLALLNAVLAERPELHVHVLTWDFSMIYTFEREALPSYKFGWRGHRRLHFALDGDHAQWASHHQKVVVVDDRVAFAGGLDLTIRRWDTPEHGGHDRRRVDPKGEPYHPIHDVQMMVDGEAAAALGQLARDRWQAATGEKLAVPRRGQGDPDLWSGVPVDLAGAEVGISRTAADDDRGPHVQEVLAVTLAAIAQARRTIFIENQFLTSGAVGEALARRLEEPDGPEVVLILPRLQSGWLEQSSMGILRARLLSRLRQVDRHGRLHVLHPVAPDLGDGCVNVHSKVLVVDDRFLKIGSANLSNRSMSLDSECDLSVEADDTDQGRANALAIGRFRTRLLAEHLGVAPDLVEERVREHGVARAIAWLRGGPRSLEPLEEGVAPVVNLAVLDGLVADPEWPATMDKLVNEFVPDHARPPANRALGGLAVVLASLVLVAALWKFSPLVRWLGLEGVSASIEWLRAHPVAPLTVLALFLAGALVCFPASLLVGATVLIYGFPRGVVLAWAGSLVASMASYAVGRLLPRREVRGRWPAQMMWLRGQLRRRGFLAIAVARLVPVGNSSVINMVAGSLRVPLWGYLVGNAVGILPGILAILLFTDRVARALRAPGVTNVALLAGLLGLVGWGLWWLGRRLARGARAVRPLVPVGDAQT